MKIYELNVRTNKGTIQLKFSNLDSFVRIAGFQLGILFGVIEDAKTYCQIISKNLSIRWKEKEGLGLFDLNDNASILDIGSGVGLIDLVLYKYLQQPGKFYLIDKGSEEDSKKVIQWGVDHGFYNDWNVLYDLARHSEININYFELLQPDSPWPASLDLIMSSNSYLWHYPLETYWSRILPYATKGCALGFDILNRNEFDAQKYISEALSQEAIKAPRAFPEFHWHTDNLVNISGSYGEICCWNVQK